MTVLSAETSSTALVAIVWPMLRLLPWPMISSGCSLAIAARTTSSTSLASLTLSVSTDQRVAKFGPKIKCGVTPGTVAGAVGSNHGPQPHFDRDGSVHDIDSSI